MHINFAKHNVSDVCCLNGGLGKLGKKKRSRKDAYMEQKVAELEVAFRQAESDEADKEDIENAEKLQKEYEEIVKSYEATAKKKSKGIVPQLIKFQERKIKFLAKLKLPTFATHVKHAERKKRAAQIKLEVMRLQGQKPSPERDAKLAELSAEIQTIAKKEKDYMKQGAIVATIISVVIGVFTFGGGAVAVQGAVQAIKQGAINIAKSILMSAILGAMKKGASKKDTDKAIDAVNDLEKYPPDPNLPTLDAMLKDSQAKKQARSSVLPKNSWLVPAGVFAALTLFS